MRTWSLRARLVATVLLLLAITAAVVGTVTALTLRDFLQRQLDNDLRTSTRVMLGSGPGPGGMLVQRRLDTLLAVIRGGRLVTASVATPDGERPVTATDHPTLTGLVVGGPPVSATVSGFGDYRLIATPAPNGDVIVNGLPEDKLEATVAQLVNTELVVTVLALAGAGLIGLIVVRRELRPLERVAGTAKRVSALPLDRGEVSLVERVPAMDPGTEVGQVGAALNHMLDHVDDALQARQASETQLRQFVADASHELRTPLAAIRGYTELSRRDELPPDTAYSLARISSQTERMTGLVEDLLLLARLDSGRPLEQAPVDLTRLVLDAVNDAHVAGPEHRWTLDVPAEPVLGTGDASRLAQVLANLLANARTHTPPGTTVEVRLTEQAELSVVDDGPGIAPDLLPHVFERFARGSASRSREHGSTGLGLAIVAAVVAAHGGSVTVDSAPGRTMFRVRLRHP